MKPSDFICIMVNITPKVSLKQQPPPFDEKEQIPLVLSSNWANIPSSLMESVVGLDCSYYSDSFLIYQLTCLFPIEKFEKEQKEKETGDN